MDATGQMGGGTGAALKHYQDEKAKGNNYPLAVKLGTITPHGADVYWCAPLVNVASLSNRLVSRYSW